MLLTNSLGDLEPTASISHFGGAYGKGGYLSLSTIANSPHRDMRWENTPEAISEIADWAESNGYEIREGKDLYGAYRATLTHIETAKAKDAQIALLQQKFENAEQGYIRFGDIPACGYSKNAASGENEKGVSVFKAEFSAEGNWKPVFTSNQQLGSYLSLLADNRPVYRVWGEEVGSGGDGEPVLIVSKIERK